MTLSGEYPPLWVKRPHREGCEGVVTNRHQRVNVDRTGRVGNGGIVAHEYRCNWSWNGCQARVLIAERTIRTIAADALGEPAHIGRSEA